jgi:molybdate transport system permease protein
MDWGPIILTFKLAFITTLILLVIATPLAFWMSNTKSKWRVLVETLVSLPLVLPPTVLGFYLLMAFSPSSEVGYFLNEHLGLQLAFSFEGLIVGSVIYSLPFMVQPIQSGLNNLPKSLSEAAYILGKSKWNTLLNILLPNIKASLLTGIVLSFAHTIGEFGVVLMIGGNIPDKTRLASIAIYDEVEALNYTNAHTYSLLLLAVTFGILLLVYSLNGKILKNFSG